MLNRLQNISIISFPGKFQLSLSVEPKLLSTTPPPSKGMPNYSGHPYHSATPTPADKNEHFLKEAYQHDDINVQSIAVNTMQTIYCREIFLNHKQYTFINIKYEMLLGLDLYFSATICNGRVKALVINFSLVHTSYNQC